MLTLSNISFYDGKTHTGDVVTIKILDGRKWEVFSGDNVETTDINAVGLTALPALIDPHVHFRTPGHEHKENWLTGSKAALAGGYTTVLDMPNTFPSCTTQKLLEEKDSLIKQQLSAVGLPHFRYGLYIGADRNQFDEIPKARDSAAAIKVYMGSSTGNLLMDDEASLRKLFEIAAANNMLVAVHAEDEHMIKERQEKFQEKNFHIHSEIRNSEVAKRATALAIRLAKELGTRLYIVHVSTENEIELIRQAKKEGVEIYAEVTPHHLFLNTSCYSLAGKAQMNPPLREKRHNEVLFQAIREGVIDTIGSDHAPHTREEKALPYGICPSGVPGIETTLSLLLDAYSKGWLTLKQIVDLAHHNPKKIFKLEDRSDLVLVDLNTIKKVVDQHLHTKCKWSPFAGWELKGTPIITVLNGEAINVSDKDLSGIANRTIRNLDDITVQS